LARGELTGVVSEGAAAQAPSLVTRPGGRARAKPVGAAVDESGMSGLLDFFGSRYDFFGARFMLALLDPSSLSDLRREEGQTMAEYALILALVAAVVAVVVALLGNTIKGFFGTVGSQI
jgi:Flp pilus assembly pilin Flp